MLRLFAMSVALIMLQGCFSNPIRTAFSETRCTGYGYKQGTNEVRDCVAAESRSSRQSAKENYSRMMYGD